MKLSKVKAMAFSLMPAPINEIKVDDLLSRDPVKVDWLHVLEQFYMCCEHIPLDEMLSDDPGMVAEWFMKESRKHHWQQRQMSPLGHLDIIAVGESLYMIYDKFGDDAANYPETPLLNTPEFELLTLKEEK